MSPDGKFVGFASDRSGRFDLWIGQVGGGQFLNLTPGQSPPVFGVPNRPAGFAGDGAHVWYRVLKTAAVYQIWLVPTLGGPAHLFLPNAIEAAWSPDESRIASTSSREIRCRGRQERREPAPNPARDQGFSQSLSPVVRRRPVHLLCSRYSARGHGRLADPILGRGARAPHNPSWEALVIRPSWTRARSSIVRQERTGSGLYAMDIDRRVTHAITSGLEEYTSISASADGRHLVRLRRQSGAESVDGPDLRPRRERNRSQAPSTFRRCALRGRRTGPAALFTFRPRPARRAMEVEGRRRGGAVEGSQRGGAVPAGDCRRRRLRSLSSRPFRVATT